MASVQVKKVNLIGKDLQDEFANILGFGEIDGVVVSDLYPRMIDKCREYIQVMSLFLDKMIVPCSQLGQNTVVELVRTFRKLSADFIGQGRFASVRANSGIASAAELKMLNTKKQSLQHKLAQHSIEYDPVHLAEVWRGIKTSDFIQFVVITTNSIKQLLNAESGRTGKKITTLDENINFNFIRNAPAADASMFGFNNLYVDLNVVLNYAEDMDGMNGDGKSINTEFLYRVLRIIFVRGCEIYRLYVTPDINVHNFSTILVGSLAKLKFEIQGCDRAFKVMEKSVKMLEDNFPEYYERVVITSNTAVIIEGFVEDLLNRKDVQNDPIVKSQMDRLVKSIGEKVRTSVSKDSNKYKDILDNYTSHSSAK